ncbi:MAG: ribosomal-processing cysteine protease Prp [Bacilli bacterium]|nr:ribosomal-processing cysteine protease Prp [Bacilli bacterium]
MIKIKVEYDNNFISKIVITGHANYDDYGKDIVCAAVSASVLTTINGIIALDNSILEVDNILDKMTIKVLKNEKNSQVLLNSMLSNLKSLVVEYPKNIKIYD